MDRLMREIWKESSYKDAVRDYARKKTAREMARLALEGRFGTLSDDMLAAIRAADMAALKKVIAHITSDTLEQARARLGLS